jgi:hypothetical protein
VKLLDRPHDLSLSLGPAASVELYDGEALYIRPSPDGPSEIFIRRCWFPDEHLCAPSPQAACRQLLEFFFDRCARVPSARYSSFDRAGLLVTEGSAFTSDSRRWTARIICLPEPLAPGAEYLLIHADGPEQEFEPLVLPTFESLRPTLLRPIAADPLDLASITVCNAVSDALNGSDDDAYPPTVFLFGDGNLEILQLTRSSDEDAGIHELLYSFGREISPTRPRPQAAFVAVSSIYSDDSRCIFIPGCTPDARQIARRLPLCTSSSGAFRVSPSIPCATDPGTPTYATSFLRGWLDQFKINHWTLT